MRLEKYLVISTSGQSRVVAGKPALRLDEFAYRLVVTIPDTWATVLGDIHIGLPEPCPTVELYATEGSITEGEEEEEEPDG